ncbi:MAG TPA: hypothetical protein G4O08_03200 [Anaerolineae bacterium]|nr:hypothetical protein [Anaerolineae bacterium]
MLGKTGKAFLLVLALSLVFTGVAYADNDVPEARIRVTGRITTVDLSTSSFGLQGRDGQAYTFFVTGDTIYRSKDGSIQSLADVEPDMVAIVVAIRNDQGQLEVLGLGAAVVEPKPELKRFFGTVTAVSLPRATLTLETRDGESITFQTTDRTNYRSRDGSIQGLGDIEPDMLALVGAVEVDGGLPQAIVVVVAHKDDIKPQTMTATGEITNVIPGQQTFMLTTGEGREYTFLVNERTRFRSRDGSIEDIHDLKQGMHAIVVAVEQRDGSLLALGVAAGYPQQDPDTVHAVGRIVDLGNRSFTLQTRNGDQLTFTVDGSTVYRSRDGSVQEFGDLRVGMVAVTRAKVLGNEQLRAIWVGVGKLRSTDDAAPPERTPAENPSMEPGLRMDAVNN